jgi:CheY-like chemotaxis protein
VSRILIVDDEPGVADLIDTVLREEGYTVAIARDGIEGLQLARGWEPDLILMDVMVPGLDGGAAIRRLKGDPATEAIPIIAISAASNIRRLREDLKLADAALSKPFDIDALLAQVDFHLTRHDAEES